jgi:hypothetical protein
VELGQRGVAPARPLEGDVALAVMVIESGERLLGALGLTEVDQGLHQI